MKIKIRKQLYFSYAYFSELPVPLQIPVIGNLLKTEKAAVVAAERRTAAGGTRTAELLGWPQAVPQSPGSVTLTEEHQ